MFNIHDYFYRACFSTNFKYLQKNKLYQFRSKASFLLERCSGTFLSRASSSYTWIGGAKELSSYLELWALDPLLHSNINNLI